MNYPIRLYQLGDEEQIVQLLQLSFSGWPHFDLTCKPLDHWRWKYQFNPLKKSSITVGVSNDKIIGVSHQFLLNIKIGNRIFICDFGADTAVHSDHQGKGIHSKMNELSIQQRKKIGSNFTYLTTSNPILIKSFSKRRKRFPYSIRYFVRIHDIDLHLKMKPRKWKWIFRLGYHFFKTINSFKKILMPSKTPDCAIEIYQIDQFVNGIDDFLKEVSTSYDFIVQRTRDYLNWRYCDSRGGNYVVNIAAEKGKIMGYSVLRINKYQKNYPVGYIVDLITILGRLEIADALIKDAINFFDNKSINIIECLIPKNHPYSKVYKKYDFIDSRQSIIIFFIPLVRTDEIDALSKGYAQNIYFSFGDTDSI
jgi:hypothetical protein